MKISCVLFREPSSNGNRRFEKEKSTKIDAYPFGKGFKSSTSDRRAKFKIDSYTVVEIVDSRSRTFRHVGELVR